MMILVFGISSFGSLIVLLEAFGFTPFEHTTFPLGLSSDGIMKQVIVWFYYGLWFLVAITSLLDVRSVYKSISLRASKITPSDNRYINISIVCVMILAVFQFTPLSSVVFWWNSNELLWSIALVICIVLCIFRITQGFVEKEDIAFETTPLHN